MNGSKVLNHSMAAVTVRVVSGSTSVPKSLKYRYGIGDPTLDLPPLNICEKCHKNTECTDIPVSNDWYVLCPKCEEDIKNLVRKEVYQYNKEGNK